MGVAVGNGLPHGSDSFHGNESGNLFCVRQKVFIAWKNEKGGGEEGLWRIYWWNFYVSIHGEYCVSLIGFLGWSDWFVIRWHILVHEYQGALLYADIIRTACTDIQHQLLLLGAVSRMTSPNPYWPINVLGTTQCWSIRSLFDRNRQWNGWDRVTRSRGLGVYATWLGLGWGWEAEWADAEIFFWSKMHSHNYINEPVDLLASNYQNRYQQVPRSNFPR